MSRRSRQQLRFPFLSEIVPAHVVVVRTDDLDLETESGAQTAVERMLAVPMHQTILLDFLRGRRGRALERTQGRDHQLEGLTENQIEGLTENQIEFWRLQRLLNSKYRSRRFDWQGDSLTARLARNAIAALPEILAGIQRRREEHERPSP